MMGVTRVQNSGFAMPASKRGHIFPLRAAASYPFDLPYPHMPFGPSYADNCKRYGLFCMWNTSFQLPMFSILLVTSKKKISYCALPRSRLPQELLKHYDGVVLNHPSDEAVLDAHVPVASTTIAHHWSLGSLTMTIHFCCKFLYFAYTLSLLQAKICVPPSLVSSNNSFQQNPVNPLKVL